MKVSLLTGLVLAIVTTPSLAAGSPIATALRARLVETLDRLEDDGEAAAAAATLDDVFDACIAWGRLGTPRDGAGHDDDRGLLVDAALARRMTRLLDEVDPAETREHVRLLREQPRLARTLLFLVRPEYEKPAEVFAVLRRLTQTRPTLVANLPELTAALCVVHDRPLRRRYNENVAEATDVVALLEFFAANEGRMLFGLRDVPAELLVYVVDSTASIPEMRWALQAYGGDVNVGARFFEIEYDYAHLQGQPKKVTLAGWNLPNIRRFGGVCADQAYFAVSVGKAIGVPTAYTRGAGGDVSHAWVGFLQSDGRRAWWNFEAGRYEAYQGIRGNVVDPQTRRTVPDGYVSLLADHVSATRADREAAAALTDAALRLGEARRAGATLSPLPCDGLDPASMRATTVESQLDLIEAALRAAPGSDRAWWTVQELAAAGELSLEQKKRWAEVLHRLCGDRYPDFSLAVLAPMVATVDDVDEQNALWNAAFRQFARRPDLAASVRMKQAEMWLEHGMPARAGQCYEDVVNRFANAGPFALQALVEAEQLLRESRDPRRILALYDRAWARTRPPTRDTAGVFYRQSNWYRIGSRYATLLEEAGRPRDAATVRARLGT